MNLIMFTWLTLLLAWMKKRQKIKLSLKSFKGVARKATGGSIPKPSLLRLIFGCQFGRHKEWPYFWESEASDFKILKVRCVDCRRRFEWSYEIFGGIAIEKWGR